MNKNKLVAIGILPIMWLVYFAFEVITGRVNDFYTVIMNLLVAVLFGFIGLLVYSIGAKNNVGLNSKQLLIIFLILFTIEQGSKLIIKFNFFNYNITLIKDFLYFSPIINTQGSWLNARFGAGVSFGALIVLNILALIFFTEIYRYFTHNTKKDFWIDMSYIFLITGCICSLIDKLFYGGSLDFIGISDLFVADIKDMYINLGILFLFLGIYLNGYLSDNGKESTFKEDIQGLKKFLVFMINDIKGFISKN
ncbi:signal peptidase II [Clostridium sp. YIM B02551]|uniref:signal peptidase II n=1 Tax=Clostridium sp. YIM B02551 TaxID=2910679 RepID=UPI001EEA7B14|nr:signal peptidase II [Clostridium sp. YIM B02551]